MLINVNYLQRHNANYSLREQLVAIKPGLHLSIQSPVTRSHLSKQLMQAENRNYDVDKTKHIF